MIDNSVLPLFITAVLILAVSPGPDLVLISTYSLSKGFVAGLMVSVGVLLAGIMQTILVAFGLGQVMESLPILAYSVKFVGVLYFSYLGVVLIRKWHLKKEFKNQHRSVKGKSHIALILHGCFNNLLNPKALLFFGLFLPQFTSGQESLSTQLLFLGLCLSLLVFLVNIIFSILVSALGKAAKGRLDLGRHADGLMGVLFLGLALRLGTAKQ